MEEETGKLDPNTGLPEKQVLTKFDKLKLIDAVSANQPKNTFDVAPFDISEIDYNTYYKTLGPDKFKLQFGENTLNKHLNEQLKQDIINGINKKADEQGFFSEAFNSAMQTAVGEVIGGTIEGLGYIFDPSMWTGAHEDQKEFGNWLSQIGKGIKDWTKDEFPIYQNYEDQGEFKPWSHEWWFSNIPSIASSLSILIPVMGEAKAVSYLGKGIQAFNAANKGAKALYVLDKAIELSQGMGKTTKWMIDGIHKATVSRGLEGLMESAQVHEQMMDKYLSAGYSEEEAAHYASEAAAMDYRLNWGAMLTDIPQYLLLGSNQLMSKPVVNARLAKAAGLNVGSFAGLTTTGWSNIASQAGLEGLEEAYQYVISEESMYNSDRNSGLVEYKPLNERLSKYTKAGEFWTSVTMGALGGGIMQAAMQSNKLNTLFNKYTDIAKSKITGDPITKEYKSDVDIRIEEINKRNTQLMEDIGHLNAALETNDPMAINRAKERIAFNAAISAAQVGNLDLALANMDHLANMSEEERVNRELPDTFKEDLEHYKERMQYAANLYIKNQNKFHPASVLPITYRQYLIDNLSRQRPLLQNEINELKNYIPNINELSTEGKELVDLKINILSTIQTRNMLARLKEHLANNTEIQAEGIEKIDHLLSVVRDMLAKSQEEYSNKQKDYSDKLTEKDKLGLEYLNSTLSDELIKVESKLKGVDYYLNRLNKNLLKLTSREYQSKLPEMVKRLQELKAKQKVKEEENKKEVEAKEKVEPKKKEVKEKPIIEDEDTYVEEEQQEVSLEEFAQQIIDNGTDIDSLGMDNDTKEKVKEAINKILNSEPQESIDDYNEVEEAKLNLDESETAVNESGGDIVARANKIDNDYNLFTLNALAWLSMNNRSRSTLDEINDNSIQLTNYLEDYTNQLKDTQVVFSIDFDYLKKEAAKGDLLHKEILNRITKREQLNQHWLNPKDNEAYELIGYLPIKASLYKNGKPVVHNGVELYMHLHNIDHTVSDKIQESFVKTLIQQKLEILAAYHQGKTLMSDIVGKSQGKLINEKKEDLNPSRTLSDVLGNLDNITFLVGADGSYRTYNNKEFNTGRLVTATNGAVYANVKSANGNNFPLRLNVSNLTGDEAGLIYQIMLSILRDQTLFSKPLTQELIDSINTSKSNIIKGIGTYIDLSTLTHKDLLDHLVYNGYEKTKTKKESALYIVDEVVKDGQTLPRAIIFGDYKTTLDKFELDTVRNQFIAHLVKNRRRQIQRSLLNKKEYKNYLSQNRILNSSVRVTNGKLFVQPTVTFKGAFSEFKSQLEITSQPTVNESKPNKKQSAIDELREAILNGSINEGITENEEGTINNKSNVNNQLGTFEKEYFEYLKKHKDFIIYSNILNVVKQKLIPNNYYIFVKSDRYDRKSITFGKFIKYQKIAGITQDARSSENIDVPVIEYEGKKTQVLNASVYDVININDLENKNKLRELLANKIDVTLKTATREKLEDLDPIKNSTITSSLSVVLGPVGHFSKKDDNALYYTFRYYDVNKTLQSITIQGKLTDSFSTFINSAKKSILKHYKNEEGTVTPKTNTEVEQTNTNYNKVKEKDPSLTEDQWNQLPKREQDRILECL